MDFFLVQSSIANMFHFQEFDVPELFDHMDTINLFPGLYYISEINYVFSDIALNTYLLKIKAEYELEGTTYLQYPYCTAQNYLFLHKTHYFKHMKSNHFKEMNAGELLKILKKKKRINFKVGFFYVVISLQILCLQ